MTTRLPDLTDLADLPDLADLAPRYAVADRSRPHLRVTFVTSVDGAAAVDGSSVGLSGPADKRVWRVLRMLSDAVLVGAGTLRREPYSGLRLDGPRRAWRVEHGLPEYPVLAVVSGRLDLDPGLPALADAPVRPVVLTHHAAPADRRAALAAVADVVTCGATSSSRAVDLTAARDELAARGLAQVLCEGGPVLFGGLLAADLVDELCLTVTPALVGSGAGRIVAGQQALPAPPRPLRLAHVLTDGSTLLLRYLRGS